MRTLRFHLQALPPGSPPGEPVFLSGNFNEWQPADPRFCFEQEKDGSWKLEFQSDLNLLEFKVTRGSWSAAEGDGQGNERPNRRYKAGFPVNELWLRVESWTDMRDVAGGKSLPENVILLHPAFFSPQLGRVRRIWACLPPDYRTATDQRYPVVYMLDGQNLFDNPDAVFGSWGIDQALNRLFLLHKDDDPRTADHVHQPIFIAVENSGEHRISEYSPWINPEYGGGEGDAYLDFVCETLKPFVDERLRTLSDREHSGIMGSSLGGLMALYAAIERPDVFSMSGVFSPSLWFSGEIIPFVQKHQPIKPVRILLMAGQQESKTMTNDLLDLYETLLEAGHDDQNLHYDLHTDGVHAEWFWAREFEHALRWLFGDTPGHIHGFSNEMIHFSVDTKNKDLIIRLDRKLREPVLEIIDYCCDRQFRHPLHGAENRIPYSDWETCLYSIRLRAGDDLLFSRRVHLNELKPYQPKHHKPLSAKTSPQAVKV